MSLYGSAFARQSFRVGQVPASWRRRLHEVLDSGNCEPLKPGVHGVLLATMALCAAYNGAVWIRRRQLHLAINTIVYGCAVYWERCHIVHHLNACVDEPVEEAKAA